LLLLTAAPSLHPCVATQQTMLAATAALHTLHCSSLLLLLLLLL
jgi:hypothetical protein